MRIVGLFGSFIRLLLFSGLVAVAGSALAQITATVDRNQVGLNESFRLTLEAEGAVEAPDFSDLQQNFEILDQSQNQSISIVNGQTSRRTTWELVLMAKHEGEFVIPPLRTGNAQSQAINISVSPEADLSGQEQTIYLDVEVDVKEPYVQQQVMFTVRLFRSVEIASASLSDLEVTGVDALVERLGDDKNYQVLQNGRRWRVVERQFLVFPQQSGHMTIRPLEFRGRLITQSSGLGFGIFSQRSGAPVVLRSESVTLRVREPPATFAGPWLPAKQLELSESWPGTGEVTVGEPVTRILSLRALGLSAAQLPDLQPRLPSDLRAYPEQPVLTDSGQAQGVVGTREQTVALIPTKPGLVTLPEIRVAWWNVDKQQPEVAVLPEYTLNVVGGATAVPTPASVSDPVDFSDDAVAAVSGIQIQKSVWPWVSLGLGFAWLITLGLWLRERRKISVHRSSSNESVPAAGNARQVLAKLATACRNNDAISAKNALLELGAIYWPETPPPNLNFMGIRCGDPVQSNLRDLESALYSKAGDWDSDRLLDAVNAFSPPGTKTGKSSAPGLEPMYRS